MKAKEYAKLYADAEDKNKCLCDIIMSLYEESIALVKSRGVKSNPGLFSIWDELDLKWKAIIRRTGDDTINGEGFSLAIKKLFAEGYDAWMSYKKKIHGGLNENDLTQKLKAYMMFGKKK